MFLIVAQEQKDFNFEEFVEKADSYMKAIENIGEFRGTVLVAEKGDIKFHKGYGMASERFDIPNGPQIKYRIGSITKSFTAICILQQVEKERINLDDPVDKYLPNYPFGAQIKIRNLLSHTSGLKRDIDFPDKTKNYPLSEQVRMTYVDSLLYSPGSKSTYSNGGYVLLHAILEKVSGMDYKSYVTKYVLEPMGLKQTGIEYTLMPPKGLADGYNNGSNRDGNYSIVMGYLQSHGYSDAVGAMYSTTEDLLKFCRQIGKSKILSEKSWKLALTPVVKNKGGYNWGLGFNILKGKTTTAYNHNGRTTGFRGGYYQFNEDDVTIIILGNYNNAARETIVSAFQRILLDREYYQPTLHKVKDLPIKELKKYVGKYKTNDFQFEIFEFKNHLYVSSHGDAPARIENFGEDAFFCKYFDLELKFKREKNRIIGCNWVFKETSMPAKKI
ncbi:penicillin-binding protein [Winogradskyella haliclonae]|uniref:Penicillin-binding protein n=2 Tax=Winogradskyella haliclonae TaxID=2048558 RepID=A0ABQ2BZ76_9FLAO|nr:penicillin-binding protein [Winogradskyella haliclonae]